MKFLPHAVALLLSGLLLPSAFAERFGSETPVTIQGTYYTAGETSIETSTNGDTRDASTAVVSRVTNRTILETMRDRTLIPTIAGYQLVMVAHAHMADGIAWFATRPNSTPVPVPTDLLNIAVSDGPRAGQSVVDSSAVLKTLKQQTYNYAGLTLAGGFTGTGVLTQTWRSRSAKNGSLTEMVELVESSGQLCGVLNADSATGVGVVQFTLAGPRVVDLTDYGMTTSTIPNYSSGSGSLTLTGSGSGTNSYSGSTTISSGTLSLGGGSLLFGLTIDATHGGTLSGLVVDDAGNITQLPTFTGIYKPNSVTIITATGSHRFLVNNEGVLTAAPDA